SGAQGAMAASVVAIALPNARAGRDRKRSQGRPSGPPRTSNPAVAAADKRNDTSNATSGSNAQPVITERASARLAHVIRPRARAANTAMSIHAARHAEPLPPAKSA